MPEHTVWDEGDHNGHTVSIPNVERRGPWQRPGYEADDIFPGFACWDKRQTGSITIGRTRLPVWAVIGDLMAAGWDYVADSYAAEGAGEDVSSFLYNLLEARGEFGRLLLTLANAERLEADRRDAVLAPHGPIVNITPGDPEAVQLPPSWWETPELAAPVVDQLRRCLAVLTEETGWRLVRTEPAGLIEDGQPRNDLVLITDEWKPAGVPTGEDKHRG